MLDQWQEELETRFGLSFQILDRAYISKVRQQQGFGVNPWNTHSRFLISQRLLIAHRRVPVRMRAVQQPREGALGEGFARKAKRKERGSSRRAGGSDAGCARG